MLIPKLRFKEFANAPEWEIKTLGDVAEINGGGTPSTEINEYWNGHINWFTPSEIGKNKFVNNSSRKISELGLKNSSAKLLPINTILLTTIATLGEMSILNTEASTNQGFQNITVNKDINRDFIFYLQSIIKYYCFLWSSGSIFLAISGSKVKNIPIPLPSLAEQSKIADFLSSLDNLIELETQKLKQIEQTKKALLQKLFPKNGETKPTLRFKEFANAPEWEVKKLGDVAEIIAGLSPESKFYNDQANGMPFYQGRAEFGRIYLKSPKFWTTKITKIAKAKNIIMSVRAPVGDINITLEDICIGRGLCSIIAKQDIYFLYFSLLTSKKIKGNGGSIFDSITKNQINNIEVYLPTLAEQNKIADFLSSVDNLIELQTQKLKQIEQTKKALLQKLFPSIKQKKLRRLR